MQRLRKAASAISGYRSAPIVAVAGEQADALAVPLNDQAIAIVFHFVNPFRPVGNLGPAGRNAGFNAELRMALR